MFWQSSPVILTRFRPQNGLFFRGSLRGFAGCSAVPISTSLPPSPMPSFLYTYLWFRTRWLGSRTHSNTLGKICLPMPSHHLLCSGRSCQECFFRPGSLWFWWRRCGHRKSDSPIFCPYWLMNHSNFRRCGTCWCSPTCGRSIDT